MWTTTQAALPPIQLPGAHFGYSLLWTLIPITIALIVVQEMVARMGVVTGKTLADLIRENFGVKATFFLMLSLLFADMGNTVAEFAGWASAMEMFGVNKYVSVPIGAFAVWLLVVKGTYRFVERIFLIACTVYLTYVVSAYFVHPPWGQIMLDTVKPSFDFKATYIHDAHRHCRDDDSAVDAVLSPVSRCGKRYQSRRITGHPGWM